MQMMLYQVISPGQYIIEFKLKFDQNARKLFQNLTKKLVFIEIQHLPYRPNDNVELEINKTKNKLIFSKFSTGFKKNLNFK